MRSRPPAWSQQAIIRISDTQNGPLQICTHCNSQVEQRQLCRLSDARARLGLANRKGHCARSMVAALCVVSSVKLRARFRAALLNRPVAGGLDWSHADGAARPPRTTRADGGRTRQPAGAARPELHLKPTGPECRGRRRLWPLLMSGAGVAVWTNLLAGSSAMGPLMRLAVTGYSWQTNGRPDWPLAPNSGRRRQTLVTIC